MPDLFRVPKQASVAIPTTVQSLTGRQWEAFCSARDTALEARRRRSAPFAGLATACLLSGCGGGGTGAGTGETGTGLYSVSVNVSGLTGSNLVLQDNLGDDLMVVANGTVSFKTALGNGQSYSVTVLTQPSSPAQGCAVSKGAGKIASSAVVADVVCHDRGRFAYVANDGDETLSAYSIDATTGRLTPLPFSPLTISGSAHLLGPIAISPSGDYLYVEDSSALTVFRINQTDGSLTVVQSSYDGGACGPMVLDRTGRYVYAACGETLYQSNVDPTSGMLGLPVQSPGSGAHSYAYFFAGLFPPNTVEMISAGSHLYLTDSANQAVAAFNIDESDGWLTSDVPGSPWATGAAGISTDPNGHVLYAAENGSSTLVASQIDAATGALTPLSSVPYPNFGLSAVDGLGRFLFTATDTPGGTSTAVASLVLDPTTGAIGAQAPGSPVPTANEPAYFAADPTGRFLYSVGYSGLQVAIEGFSIGTDGALTAIPGGAVPGGKGPADMVID